MTEERREGWNRRQIDNIEKKVNELLKIMNGNGKIGMTGKVDIMWGYRNIFMGLFSINLIAVLTFIIMVFKGGN